MSTGKPVVFRPLARLDVLEEYAYYANEASVAVADRFLVAAERAVEQIAESPRSGSPKTFQAPEIAGIRSMPIRAFRAIRIYYREEADQIVIVRVLHGKRDVETILSEDR